MQQKQYWWCLDILLCAEMVLKGLKRMDITGSLANAYGSRS